MGTPYVTPITHRDADAAPETDRDYAGMDEPHACDDCGTVYDEARGEGYCGQCPACADLAYEADFGEDGAL